MIRAAQNIQNFYNRSNSRKVMQFFYQEFAKIGDFHVDLRSDDDIYTSRILKNFEIAENPCENNVF